MLRRLAVVLVLAGCASGCAVEHPDSTGTLDPADASRDGEDVADASVNSPDAAPVAPDAGGPWACGPGQICGRVVSQSSCVVDLCRAPCSSSIECGTAPLQTTQTEPDGRFRLSPSKAGRYVVRVKCEPRVGIDVAGTVEEGAPLVLPDLSPRSFYTGALFGTVKLAGVRNCEPWLVTLTGLENRTARVDAYCRFQFDKPLQAGEYEVRVDVPSTVEGSLTYAVRYRDNVPTTLNPIEFQPLGKLAGYVTSAGTPAVGALVFIESLGRIELTDGRGRFAFASVPTGFRTVQVGMAGHRPPAPVLVAVEYGRTATVPELALEADPAVNSGDLTVKATLPDRTDHAGTSVRITDTGQQAVTDSEGLAVIHDVPAGIHALEFENGPFRERISGVLVAPGLPAVHVGCETRVCVHVPLTDIPIVLVRGTRLGSATSFLSSSEDGSRAALKSRSNELILADVERGTVQELDYDVLAARFAGQKLVFTRAGAMNWCTYGNELRAVDTDGRVSLLSAEASADVDFTVSRNLVFFRQQYKPVALPLSGGGAAISLGQDANAAVETADGRWTFMRGASGLALFPTSGGPYLELCNDRGAEFRVSRDGATAAVACFKDLRVVRLGAVATLVSDRPLAACERRSPSRGFAFSPGSAELVYAAGDGSLTALDVANGLSSTAIAMAPDPCTLTYTEGGKLLYASAGRLWVRPAVGANPVELGPAPVDYAVTPDGAAVVTLSATGTMESVPLAGGAATLIATNVKPPVSEFFVAGGRAFYDAPIRELWSAPLDGSGGARPIAANVTLLRRSPAGSKLAMRAEGSLIVVDAATLERETLLGNPRDFAWYGERRLVAERVSLTFPSNQGVFALDVP